MLVLMYGRNGWFAPLLRKYGVRIVFAFPGVTCLLLLFLDAATHLMCERPPADGSVQNVLASEE